MRLVVDHRDDLTWIAIELTGVGETKVEEGTITNAIRADLEVPESFPVFVPSVTYLAGGQQVVLHLMEGYVFVASGLPETRYFALEKRNYVSQVMSTYGGTHAMRVPSVIPNAQILVLKHQLRGLVSFDINVGEDVHILDGAYRGLEGVVQELDGDNAYVLIELRSIKIIATVPRVFLSSDTEEG
ncbi:MAG: transcription termination/antitermination protein NusG [Planctomycetota bacterium]|jgi:transcription antitermination factor NusG